MLKSTSTKFHLILVKVFLSSVEMNGEPINFDIGRISITVTEENVYQQKSPKQLNTPDMTISEKMNFPMKSAFRRNKTMIQL